MKKCKFIIAFLTLILVTTLAVGVYYSIQLYKQENAENQSYESVVDEPATVYDSPADNTIIYVEANCPVCGERAIASTETIVCINNDCPEYGLPQEQQQYYGGDK